MKKFMILISTFGLMVGTSFGQTWNIGYPNEEDVVATLEDGTLTIRGTGDMDNYTEDFFGMPAPWNDYLYQIEHVEIKYGVTSIGACAFWRSGLNSITIPASVTSIGEEAFGSCSSLTSIEIPSSVTSIEKLVFNGCNSLTSIDVKNGNEYYSSENGVLFNKNKTTLIRYPEGKVGSYTIPNSVTSIGEGAFGGCSSLTSIKIPNSVTSIGNGAFSGCGSLTSIEISSSVTSIGDFAFFDCSSLIFIEIPSSVTSIGDFAFFDCSSLTSIINYSNTPQNIIVNIYFDIFTTFHGVSRTKCTIYVPAESVELYKRAACWKEFTILPILPGAVVTNVSDIEIPAGVGIVVVPERESARIAWNVTEVAVEDAVSYTLVIKKSSTGETICSLEFDAIGRLVGVTLKSQDDVFGVRITNLSENTTYTYTMKAMGANNVVLSTRTGEFTTTGGGNGVGIVETWRAASLPVPGIVGYFNLTGQKLTQAPERGIYIILYDNGTSARVMRE